MASVSVVQKEEAYSLSSNDLKRLVPGCKIIVYPQLAQTKSVQELLQNRAQCCFILVPLASATSGHWTVLFKAPDGVHFFDPMGVSADAARLFAPQKRRAELHESQPLLMPLLQKAQGPVHINSHDYQKCSPAICTCGRHCCVRVEHRDMTDPDYQQWMSTFPSPDAEVSQLTAAVLHK